MNWDKKQYPCPPCDGIVCSGGQIAMTCLGEKDTVCPHCGATLTFCVCEELEEERTLCAELEQDQEDEDEEEW